MDPYCSDSESEDDLVEKLKLLSPELTPDEKGYDVYLERYLPLLGVRRPHAGKPESKAYKIGLLHYVESPEHGCDPEESVLSAFADREIPESLGCLEYNQRVKGFEITKSLLACSLNRTSRPGAVEPSNSVHFELVQRDVIDVCLDSGCTASAYLLQPTISCSASSPKQLLGATVSLSLPESEGCGFLGVQDPPFGAECVAAYNVGSKVIFSEGTYVGNAPCKVLYVGHETAGSSSSSMVNITKAEVQLQPHHGSQFAKQLSGQMLACIADDEQPSYSMQVSVKATAARPSSRMPVPLRSEEQHPEVYVLDRVVQI